MKYDIKKHYILEKKLADQLRSSSAEDRKILYQKLYNELFTEFPEISGGVDSSHSDYLVWQLRFLKPFLNKKEIFLEIGAGDCLLSKELAKYCENVVAYEVASSIPFIEGKPTNFELKIFNGIEIYEQKESFDIIYSNQVFEHLHPDDIPQILNSYHSFLKNSGKLIIVTPHILTGPHDISRHFSDKPEGFHLKEYTYNEINSLLAKAGFIKIKGYIGYSKIGYFPVNINFLIFMEKLYKKLPFNFRKRIKANKLIFNFFGIKILGQKRNDR